MFCFASLDGARERSRSHPQPAFGGQSRRAKIPSPQPPSFLPACLGFALKFFERADGGALGQFNASLNSFEVSYSQLSASLAASTKSVSNNKATTTTDILEIATTTTDVLKITATTSDISIVLPAKDDNVYIGCNYKISWQPAITIQFLDLALFDAGTRKPMGPIASGLAATSAPAGFEYLDWRVGNVWPGEYYISISKINNEEIVKTSGVFTVHKLPEGENPKSFCNR